MGFIARFIAAEASALAYHLHRYRAVWAVIFVAVVLIVNGYRVTLSAPENFPEHAVVVVPEGASARETADILAAAHVVRSADLLRLVLRVTGGSAHVHPGPYRFDRLENALVIASRLSRGAFGIPPIRLTFVEGDTTRDMANEVADAFPDISAAQFLSVAAPYEGYLFPDTYLFPPDATAASIVAAMRKNFDVQTAPLASAIAASGHSESDIIIMASLIEREARSTEARRMVSSILWNRIADGMPLQVDAVFGYIFGRDTYSPSFDDLKTDSPYNTYTHDGLPPGPICNPGLDAIATAIQPAESAYLYYLTGTDGQMHYAKTYAGQLANQRAYLK